MLDTGQRVVRYLYQTGRNGLTARQRRRIRHKIDHQSYAAAARRDARSAARAKTSTDNTSVQLPAVTQTRHRATP